MEDLKVCVECYQVNANGFSYLDLSEDRTAEILKGFKWFKGEYLLINADCEPSFSTSPCPVCWSHSAGDRFTVQAEKI